jgi:hypothetical protein
MGVLAMLELDGDTAALLGAAEKLEDLLPAPEGLRLRIVAPTDGGIVLFQLWESAEARQHNADEPGHAEALEASGMTSIVRGSSARAFEGAELRFGDESASPPRS